MNKKATLFAMLLVLTGPALAGKITTGSDGRLITDRYSVCTWHGMFSGNHALQIQVHADAEKGLDRDKFNDAVSATMGAEVGTLMQKKHRSHPECKPTSELIGQPDLVIHVDVNRAGIQVTTTDTTTGQVSRYTKAF